MSPILIKGDYDAQIEFARGGVGYVRLKKRKKIEISCQI